MPGVDAFLHRPGIDVARGLRNRRRLLAHPRQQRVEALLDDDVIVVAPRVARDRGDVGVASFARSSTGRSVL